MLNLLNSIYSKFQYKSFVSKELSLMLMILYFNDLCALKSKGETKTTDIMCS